LVLFSACVNPTTAWSVPHIAPHTVIVKDRIPVIIGLEERTPVASLRVNDVVLARIRRPIRVADIVVVETDSPVILKVKYVRKRGILGSPAKVTLSASHIELRNQQQLRLSGEWTLEGEDLSIEAISCGAALCCFGFFLPGGEVVLAKGGGFSAFIDGNQQVVVYCGDTDAER